MKKAPAKLGTVWTATATLFGNDGKRVARCSDTPNAIAAAFIKNPSASLVKTMDKYVDRSEFDDRIEMLINKPEQFKMVLKG